MLNVAPRQQGKTLSTVKSREHASRPGRKQSSQNKKARNKDAYIKNTKEGKNCWRNIVAGILGRNGIMNKNAAEAGWSGASKK